MRQECVARAVIEYRLARGLVVKAEPWAIFPLSFSFTNGSTTITQANQQFMHFDLATDSQGNISSWEVEVSTSEFPPENFLEMSTIAARFGIEDGTCKGLPCSMDLALVDDNPGTWTSTSNVPEPSSLLQLGLGFMGILGLYLRSRRSLKPTEQL